MEWLHIPFNRSSTGRRVQEIAESPIRRDEMGIHKNLIASLQSHSACDMLSKMIETESIPRQKSYMGISGNF